MLGILLPTDCLVCRQPLGEFQHQGVCAYCWTGFVPLPDSACPGCGIPCPAATDLLGPARGRCARCLLLPPPVDGVKAAVVYDRSAGRILREAKLGPRRELLHPLAAQMVALARTSRVHDGCTILTAIPSHPWTDLRRGFSPSRELARLVASELGIRHRPGLLVRSLRGTRATKRLRASTRARLARRAFRCRSKLSGEGVLLVDDVLTTGSSLEACARAVRRAGAGAVRAIAWARALQ